MPTGSSSSSPSTETALIRVPLDRMHPHPANPNVMGPALLEKLRRNIERDGRYPPLLVRPHPTLPDAYEILDGRHRCQVLQQLGHADALCYVWPCDDPTALRLLATLNRLHGEDVPVQRAQLLAELSALVPSAELALLLPEDAAQIDDLLSLLTHDTDALLAELTRATASATAAATRAVTFAVSAEDEAVVESAVQLASEGLTGRNRRGRALAAIARTYLESPS